MLGARLCVLRPRSLQRCLGLAESSHLLGGAQAQQQLPACTRSLMSTATSATRPAVCAESVA